MPITAGTFIIQRHLDNTAKMGVAGRPKLTSQMMTQAVASAAPMGLYPVGDKLIPTMPFGYPACQAQLNNTFNLGVAGKPALSSMQLALAISFLCPLVPPTGLSFLSSQFMDIANMGIAGKPELTSYMMARTIVDYFLIGGTI